jgi:CRISPR-associated endonuclease/helicase Cas3
MTEVRGRMDIEGRHWRMPAFSRFDEMFVQATSTPPYPYQRRLATDPCMPHLLSIPTGLGKTAAVILAWLWRRRFAGPEMRAASGRRLVYCLPMRVLVDQTRDCAVHWLENLQLLGSRGDAAGVGVHALLGGDVDDDWDQYPERDAIIVGTQDMLLSRALNRGYAMSRYRWPMQFGLLNNDCLWAMDEVQLMGNGLATTAQLQAFRRQLGVVEHASSLWMSATIRPQWLATVDFDPSVEATRILTIGDEDREHVKARYEAHKPISRAPFEATDDGKAEAELALKHHGQTPNTRTLVVVNTVKRAQTIYEALHRKNPRAELVLLHSRFRPPDRHAALGRLLAEPGNDGTIGVCTQVVEAGVDLSARVLITDLAPWPSLVQRFGRCNRKGEYNDSRDASVVWIAQRHLNDDEKVNAAPYFAEDLRTAADRLSGLAEVGPHRLPAVAESLDPTHVLRRRDLVELFDTTPDLGGADIDVSRFIREADEHDVQVFWRAIPDRETPAPNEPGPTREELCGVPVGEIDLRRRGAWRWDQLERRWTRPTALFPGLMLMLRAGEGGYDPKMGWSPKSKSTAPLDARFRTPEGNDDDPYADGRRWETIAEHTEAVVARLAALLDSLGACVETWRGPLLEAARWHDAGKAHAVFQGAMPDGVPSAAVFAKAGRPMKRYARPGFRHELASALAMLANGVGDLAAYLAAAHHGKVRLSIRSLPHEKPTPDAVERRFARGVWEGESLPVVDLGAGVTMPETRLPLAYMEVGADEVTGPSWLARTLALRDSPGLGPFRLAFLEALLRAADWRASGGPVTDPEEETTG